ncbi:endochitinase [Tubulinosema ratisbonensis]|uniref:Endochitinase n=1 Tax=Tubulinosema ratisbonensis TaxID=291195 RepID=A0A437AQH0_9MICR|nr:endochitinase [Tubulinosema ratisbonensis]
MIKKAIQEAADSPNPEYLDVVAEKVASEFDTPDEAAMFLAQIIHESAGLTAIEEQACLNGGCQGQYGSDQGEPGKSYHGRGFIQLTWPDNYKAASEGLGMGDELYKNPEKVSEDPKIAIDVSIWFWKNRVANEPGVKDGQFGATTKAINGPIECSGGGSETPQKRYDIYTKVAKAMGVENLASPDGC